jgi:hypothetical protein
LYGCQINALLGLAHRLTPNFLVGALGGYEIFDYRSDALSGHLKGDGWTVGSYLGWRFAAGLRFDAATAYSGIGYDGTAGTATGNFSGHRWLVSSALTAAAARDRNASRIETITDVMDVLALQAAYLLKCVTFNAVAPR